MKPSWTVVLLLLMTLPAQAEIKMFYLHNDHLGTPRVVTDQNQNVVWKGHLKPFGEAEVEVESITNHRRFPGQRLDIETRLHYNYFRDYDPRTGRYVQSDPIGLRGGLNTYAYVGGNPLIYTDPTGEFGVFGAAFGAGTDIAFQLAKNGGNWKCIDWADVAISGLVGFVAPGGSTAAKSIWTSHKASYNLSRQLTRARTENRRNKILRRIEKHETTISDEAINQAVWQSAKQISKNRADASSDDCGCDT